MNEPIRCNRRIIRSSLPAGRVAVGLALAFVAAGACKSAPPTIAGDGRAKVETRAVGPFRIVKASTGLRVELTAGVHGVVVRGEENLLPHVETPVVDGTLHVRARAPLKPTLPLRVTVTAPSVDLIAGSSAAKIAHHIQQDTLRIDCASGAQCDAGAALRELHLSASSGAKVSVRTLVRVRGQATSGASVRVVGSPKERALTAPSGPKLSSREPAPAHHAIHPRPGFSILTVSRSPLRHALCRRAGAHLRGRAA
jgi:hypothetical protein